jgi:hypothetical protein
MPTPLSAIIPVSEAQRTPIYVALSELPVHEKSEPAPIFRLSGIELHIFWAGRAEPFSLALAPADLAAAVAGRAVWEEVNDAGVVWRSVPIQLSA